MKFLDYAVLRHSDNNKWYGLIMDVPRVKLGLEGDSFVDILNVKMAAPLLADMLVQNDGYMRGYHMEDFFDLNQVNGKLLDESQINTALLYWKAE